MIQRVNWKEKQTHVSKNKSCAVNINNIHININMNINIMIPNVTDNITLDIYDLEF